MTEQTQQMATQICPACGCAIVTGPHQKEGVTYCCEPCATGSQCQCGCCAPCGEKEQEE